MAVVIQRNYVNCKLEGDIPEKVFQRLRRTMRYPIQGYRPPFVKRYGDGFKYLITPKRRIFPAGLLYMATKVLKEEQIEYSVMDLRTEPIPSDPIPIHNKKLRDYQEEAEQLCLKYKTGVIKIPTGGGKTLIFTSLLGRLNGLKCIIYVRKLDLMRQTVRNLKRDLNLSDDDIGIVGGGTVQIRDLSVVMIPTAARALGEKYIKYTGHDNDDEDDPTPLNVQQKKAIKEYVESADCFVIDECFPADTIIQTEDGPQRIGALVNQRYTGRVWSYNVEKDCMELKPVSNWYKRTTDTPLCRVKLHSTKHRDCVTCTENHKFYTLDGTQIEARKLNAGDVVRTFLPIEKRGKQNSSSKTRRALNDDQMQVALGSVLGDGYLYPYKSGRIARLQFTHCEEQEEYCKWKLSVFGCEDKLRLQRGGYNHRVQRLGRTYGWWQLSTLHHQVYRNKKKTITREVLNQLKPLGIAVWIMDDGSWAPKSGTYALHTEGYSYEEQGVIQRYFDDVWHLKTTIRHNKSKDKYFLYFDKQSSTLLRKIVAPHLHPSMSYKGGVKDVPFQEIDKEPLPYGLVEIYEVEKSVQLYGRTKNGEHCVFNITVDDNHNYIANGFLVSNCHCISSQSVQMVSKHSKKAYYRLGFSATPWRTDNTDILINATTGPRLIDIKASTLIERGFLVPPRVHFYRISRDWKKHPKLPTDYQPLYTQFIVEHEVRNEKIVKITDHLVEKGERPVILVQRQTHGKILEKMLEKRGRLAKFIYGESSMTERAFTLDQFEAGALDVLIGSSILQEGIDVPCITALINAAGGKSSSAYYQKIGRAIRPNDGKTRAIIIDFIDEVKWLDKHSKERIKVLKTEPLYQIKIQGET